MEVFIIIKYIKTNKILSLYSINIYIQYPFPYNISPYLSTARTHTNGFRAYCWHQTFNPINYTILFYRNATECLK